MKAEDRDLTAQTRPALQLLSGPGREQLTAGCYFDVSTAAALALLARAAERFREGAQAIIDRDVSAGHRERCGLR